MNPTPCLLFSEGWRWIKLSVLWAFVDELIGEVGFCGSVRNDFTTKENNGGVPFLMQFAIVLLTFVVLI